MTAALILAMFVVAICGTLIGCGIVRIIRAVTISRSRRNWSRVLTAKAGRA